MDSERWEQIQSLFHEAAALSADERRSFLDRIGEKHPLLKAQVLELLEADASSAPLLDRELPDVARETLGLPTLQHHSFGAYRLKKPIGEGGMGVVYLAERADVGTRAAVKILRDAWLSPARRERFMAEQRTLARLEHSGIARLYDSGTLADGTPWFVMEYVEGVPITEYCRRNSCDLRERLRLFREVCAAVQYAHGNLVVHRDIKPSNILVRSDGSTRLVDFGISKHLASPDGEALQTHSAMRMMTLAYASPEQVRGDRVGIQTDVYSLGVVLYELLTGRVPFDLAGRSTAEAERILLETEPERPSAVAARSTGRADQIGVDGVSRAAWADLDVLVLTAMRKEPERRYGSVEAMLGDIDRFLRSEPLEARGDSPAYRLGKFARRHRVPLAGAATFAVGLGVMLFFHMEGLRQARNTAVAERTRAEEIQRFTLNLLQGGDEAGGPADSLRVVTLVDRGVREARTLDSEPVAQAEVYETLGSMYQKLGRFAHADTLIRKSLDQRRRLFGSEHPDVAHSLIALGMLRNAEAKYDSAEALVSSGVAMLRRFVVPADAQLIRATVSLGQVLYEKGEYDRAIAVLDSALRLASRSGRATHELSSAITELANAHFYAGRYAVADTLNRRALRIDRELYGPVHPHIADGLMNLGSINLELQNFQQAERFYREALAVTQIWFGNDHPETASNLTLLGRSLVPQNRFSEALPYLKDALAIQERVYGRVHPRVASALNELGRVAQQQGDLTEAEANFRRMRDIYVQVHNDRHYVIGVAQSNLAGVYRDRKQYAEAERLFRDVIRRYTEQLDADHQLMGIARVRLGETLADAGKAADASRELREGLRILEKQPSPPPLWVARANDALARVGRADRVPVTAHNTAGPRRSM